MKNPLCFWRILAVCGATILAAAPALALEVGDRAPAFKATTLEGEAVDLSRILGKRPVYLKFWATWCKYCVRELPHSQSIYRAYGDEVKVLMVNVGLNDSEQNIDQVYKERGLQLPTIMDRSGDIVANYAVLGTPNHVLIDSDGKVAYRSFLATDELDARVRAMAESVRGEVSP